MLAAVLVASPPVDAGGKVEHYDMTFAIAYQVTGELDFARTVADAAWSMDENDDTTAVADDIRLQTRAASYLARVGAAGQIDELANDRGAIQRQLHEGDLRYIAQGFMHHALGSDGSRADFKSLFPKYAESVLRDHPGDETLRRVLLGMCAHTLVDSFVHPEDPVFGHGQSHQIDMLPNLKARYTAAARAVRDLMRHGLPPAIPPPASTPAGAGFEADDEFCRKLVDTLAATYTQKDNKEYVEPGADDARWALSPARARTWLRMARDGKLTPSFSKIRIGEAADHTRLGITYPRLDRYTVTIPSFLHFARTSDDPAAARMRDEVVAHVQRALRNVVKETAGRYAGQKLEERLFQKMNSFPNDYPVLDPPEPWRPKSSSGGRPLEARESQSLNVVVVGAGTPPPAPTSRVADRDVARRIVVEVQQREWATDGLEKYLAPPAPAPQDTVVRVPPTDADPLKHPSAMRALQEAAGASNATVVIVAPQQTPDPVIQHRVVAEIAAAASKQHAQVHPEAIRTLTVQGSGAGTLPAILDRTAEREAPPATRTVVVSPTVAPAAIPPDALVVMHNDGRFHNFDPGSPGYERLTLRAKEYAKQSEVIVVPSRGNPSDRASQASEATYFARGSSEGTKLSNVRLGDVTASPERNVMKLEQNHKPSKVGGISLVAPARLPIDPSRVRRARYDAASRRIVLHGPDGATWRLPEVDPELARIAYDCLYEAERAPELSIGANPDDRLDPGPALRSRVYYVGAIENTLLGLIMLRADQLLGDLAFGGSEVIERLGLRGTNLHTMAELCPDFYADGPSRGGGGADRVYLLPDVVRVAAAASGDLEFVEMTFDVRFSPAGAAEQEFAAALEANWPAVLASPGAAAFRDLVQAVRATSLMVWLRDHGIPFDASIRGIEPRRVFTPRDVPSRRAPKLKDLRPMLPLTVYDANGISRVYDARGRVSTVHYEERRVCRVERRDGTRLDVHYDSLLRPAAISTSASSLGAVFRPDPATGRTEFVDLVTLRLRDGRYAGFTTTARTRVLYDVAPQDALSTIIAAFLAEEVR